jgi:hypothetical protein
MEVRQSEPVGFLVAPVERPAEVVEAAPQSSLRGEKGREVRISP